jgi:hypothetical protein
MSGALAQFLVATTQSQTQLVFQVLKVGESAPDIDQLFFKSAPDWRTRLQAIPSQLQETSNLTELEPQTLDPSYESESLDVAFTIQTKPSLRSRRARQQGVALIEADRVNAQTDLLGDNTNLHDLNSSPEATPWSIVQSQVISPVPGSTNRRSAS